jgi:carboxyl-terminal processing protease
MKIAFGRIIRDNLVVTVPGSGNNQFLAKVSLPNAKPPFKMEFTGMNHKRFLLVAFLLFSLSCNFVTQGLNLSPTETLAATKTPVPTATFVPTQTPLPTSTPFPTPLYIPPECQNRALATLPAATTVAEPTPGLETNAPLSKAEQLKVFKQLTDTISKVYLYPDFNGLDWPGTVAEYRAKIESGLETETFYTEMGNLVAALEDDHSHFESPSEAAASSDELAGKIDYVGIGVLVNPLPEKGRFTILSVFPGSAAAYSGLKSHDSVIAVDGIPLIENGKPYSQRIRGPECSAARITVQSPGGEPRDILFVRFKVTSSLPIEARLVPTTDGSRIGYIFIPTFFDETIPGQVEKALEDFGQLDGLILDNRMNGGGASDVVEPILSHFTSGTLGQFISRSGKRSFRIISNPINNSRTMPLVVLVGEDTVSFGEIFSGILQDQGRAKVIGQTTLGNVETLSGYNFDDGSLVWIAQERFDPARSHANWEKDGIVPDVVAFADWDTFNFETDPAVAAALKIFGHK